MFTDEAQLVETEAEQILLRKIHVTYAITEDQVYG